MESPMLESPCYNQAKTPQFIRSLFDEDSGLGMEFNPVDFEDSPTLSLFKEKETNKRKRPDVTDTPVSYSKKRYIKSKHLKKSLSFDVNILNSKAKSSGTDMNVISSANDDISVEGAVLTGDGSKECCLPTVQGRFHDLRYITHSTMKDVVDGKYDDVIGSFRIIDSRYSYEYDGGHIAGAENIHNKDDILDLLKYPKSNMDGKREIIIFHCEFSSERGPKMCRFLRNNDREVNAENYPALHYPELYIMKGGYKEFYENNKELCTPMAYVPMLSKDHKEDLRHFRTKSKSWYAGQKKLKTSSSRLFC